MSGRIAVIGGGLGGLTAAGLLAREGHEVTLFEGSGALGGKAQRLVQDGLTWDTGPTLLTFPQVVRETFAAMGAEDSCPEFAALERQCHYVFDDACELDVFADLERTVASAREIRPVEGRGMRAFYEEAAAIHRAAGEPYLEAPFESLPGFMARVSRRGVGAILAGARMGTLDELARKHFRTSHLQQFVGRFATYTGASPYEASAAFALIPHIERAFGVHHVKGGIGALAAALAAAVESAGVTLRLGARMRWSREGGRWRVTPEDASGPEGGLFDAVVVNADPLASLGRSEEPLALSGYVLLLEVRGEAPLAHHTVLFGRDYPSEFQALFSGRIAEDSTVYVCNPAATDVTEMREGRTPLFVMANAPAMRSREDEARWIGWSESLRVQCLDALYSRHPDLKGRVKVVAERTPVDLARLGAPGGSIYGFLPHGTFGPFRRPKIRGEAPGLFFAGGGTHPGGGVPMVMLSGRFAAGLAHAHLRGGP